METSNMPDKEYKIMIIKMFTRQERRVKELTENFNKEIENIKRTRVEGYNN